MQKNIDIKQEKAARLTAARKATGLSRTAVAQANRWNYNTYKAHESGHREFSSGDAVRYARALGVTVPYLLGIDLLDATEETPTDTQEVQISVVSVPVYGQAAGGLWLEGDDVPFDDEAVSITPNANYPIGLQYARKVVGNSVSNRIRNGEYAVFVRLEGLPGGLRHGMLVDCVRQRAGMYEHSVKVFEGDRLMTDSAELAEQTSIPLGGNEDDTLVTIEGVAVSVVRHLMDTRRA